MSRGVAMFMTNDIYSRMSKIVVDSEGRYIITDLKEEEQIITIVVLYAPNEDKPSFFGQISELVRERSENKIVIGDFNLTLDVDIDRKNTYHNNNKARDIVLDIMDEYLLKDIWRERNPGAREYSWFARTVQAGERKASRIDLALISGGLDQKVEMVQYLSSLMTDHRAIYMVVQLNQNERGLGYWKLNTSLLQKKDFIEKMNMELDNTIAASCEKSPIERWENIKTRIKKCASNYSREKSKENGLIIANLSEKVNLYESLLPLNKTDDEIYERTKHELEDKQLERTAGIMFRSKAKWYEEGEKSTKYFYALEKAKYNNKTCFKILNENQEEITKQNEILKYQQEFYKQLYQEDKDVSFTLNNNVNIFVPEAQQEQQNKQITLNELEAAIKTMNNNKTPGEDGIPIDFYKVFWRKLKEPFIQMVLHVYETNKLHNTARNGILNLIPKPGKDARIIKNLRPITLLNTDYKIIEKAIANKMIPALEDIIHTDQRGFMKERRISVNIRKMLDIIHETKVNDLEAVVMSLDFVKCFDKCSFSILHGSLEFFKFGKIVRDWTKILYDNFSVKIQNNGYFSDKIWINKGVHQGGCCSSIYFLVIAEILAISLRNNTEIDGITLRQIRNILNQFADDMDIFSMCNQKSLRAMHSELEAFRLQSGFTVSYDKTTIYRIGSLRHSNAQLYNMDEFVWSNEDINVLGVTIAHEDIIMKNYLPVIEKARKVLKSWYNRNLSLIGKV